MRITTAIFTCLVSITICALSGRCADNPGNPLMAYPFNNDGHAAVSSVPELALKGGSFVQGPCGRALHLDGQSVLTALPPESAPRLGTQDAGEEFSITFLFRPSAKRSYQIIMAQASAGPNDRVWWIGYAPNMKRLDFLVREPDNKGQAQVFSIPTVNADEWFFVAASVSRGGGGGGSAY